MSTYLQLCQKVSRDSGIISGVNPQTVVGQTGRLFNIVNWTAEAWNDVQRLRQKWLWMQGDFDSMTAITAGTHRYTAASFAITRFRSWIIDREQMWLYDPDIGQSDEGWIEFIPWEQYRVKYERAEHNPNRPTEYSVSPAREICFGTFPDKTYVCRGSFMKDPQQLVNDGDLPECPPEYHDVIAHKAVMLLDQHGEAVTNLAYATQRYNELLMSMYATELPDVVIGGGPIA